WVMVRAPARTLGTRKPRLPDRRAPGSRRRNRSRSSSSRRCAARPQIEGDGAVAVVDHHVAAVLELAEQKLVAEGALDLVLDQAAEGARAHPGVVALLRQVRARRGAELDGDVALGE